MRLRQILKICSASVLVESPTLAAPREPPVPAIFVVLVRGELENDGSISFDASAAGEQVTSRLMVRAVGRYNSDSTQARCRWMYKLQSLERSRCVWRGKCLAQTTRLLTVSRKGSRNERSWRTRWCG